MELKVAILHTEGVQNHTLNPLHGVESSPELPVYIALSMVANPLHGVERDTNTVDLVEMIQSRNPLHGVERLRLM